MLKMFFILSIPRHDGAGMHLVRTDALGLLMSSYVSFSPRRNLTQISSTSPHLMLLMFNSYLTPMNWNSAPLISDWSACACVRACSTNDSRWEVSLTSALRPRDQIMSRHRLVPVTSLVRFLSYWTLTFSSSVVTFPSSISANSFMNMLRLLKTRPSNGRNDTEVW